jgi:hypothetical protein
VDGSFVTRINLSNFAGCWLLVAGCWLRSCVWPFDAVHVIASLDKVRTLQAALTLRAAYSVTHAELALAGFA